MAGLPKPTFVLAEDFRRHGRRGHDSRLTGNDISGPATGSDRVSEPDSDLEEPTAVDHVAESAPVDPDPEDSVPERFGAFGRLLEAGAGHLAAARAAQVEQRRQAAVQARALAAFATARPAVLLDRPDAEVGAAAVASRAGRPGALAAVSEWAVDEVMVALGLSAAAAAGLLAESVTLVQRLPATWAALAAGSIGWNHARALAEIVGPVKDEARAGVEERLLARAGGKTVAQLREAARRAVLRADAAAAARRLAAAIRDRGVRMFPGRDGMGSLSATLPLPVAQACRRALEAYAADCGTPGDVRSKEQRMVDCLVDLILRPGVNGPVQIGLTVVAGVDTLTGGDEPGEIDGQPVPAVLVRELAHTLGLLQRPEQAEAEVEPTGVAEPAGTKCPADAQNASAPADPQADPATDAIAAGLSGNEAAAVRLAELLGIRTVAGTALAHIPTIAIVEEVSGQLLALTDATGIRHTATCDRRKCRTGKRDCTHPPRGAGLGPPADSPGYPPSAALARFVRARDRRCRFPGCRATARRCDLDHNTPWPAGPTSETNLCCLCRHHHRLSHQAPGWTMHRLPDGGLQWTTPGGHTVTTHPIGYGTDDDLEGPPRPDKATATDAAATATPPPPPLSIFEQLRRWPPPPPNPDDEPPPF
jgi:hypothetical protein